jgi:hypothetical protein
MPLILMNQASSDPNMAASNSTAGNKDDQVVDCSTSWLRAPAPAKFLRRQIRAETSLRQHRQPEISKNNKATVSVGNTADNVDIDADLWTFSNNQNSVGSCKRSTESKYYIAHRQYVSKELTNSEIKFCLNDDNAEPEIWDGFLRALSV